VPILGRRHAAGGTSAGKPPDARRIHHERLDAVKLIAGQLAVSLDNAQLYGELAALAEQQAALRRVATLVAREVSPQRCSPRSPTKWPHALHLANATVVHFDDDDTLTIVH